MTSLNLMQLTDDEAAALLEDVLADRDRRQALATIPTQVAQLASAFVAGGGEQSALEAAIAVRTDEPGATA